MKIRKKKVVDTEKLADDLGVEYAAAFEKAKTADGIKHEVATRIKAIAEEVGEAEGDRRLIRGSHFVVGFVTIEGQKIVDWALFKAQNAKLYSSLVSPAIDEQKVEEAIKDGRLPRALLKKYLVNKTAPSKRIIVERAGEETDETKQE